MTERTVLTMTLTDHQIVVCVGTFLFTLVAIVVGNRLVR